jgi:hypothetical protein
MKMMLWNCLTEKQQTTLMLRAMDLNKEKGTQDRHDA